MFAITVSTYDLKLLQESDLIAR